MGLKLSAFLLFASLAAAQHSNTLSWTAPTVSAPVVISGYWIYRTKTPGQYVKGTTLNRLTASQTSYVDLDVKPGDVNYYAVSVRCDTCTVTESPFSPEVRAQTPADSAPPAIQTSSFVVISR